MCTWAALPTCRSSGLRAGERAQMQVTGLTCEFKGSRAPDAFTETQEGLKGSQASRRSLYAQGDDRGETPEGSRPSLRAVATPSVPKSHATSNT